MPCKDFKNAIKRHILLFKITKLIKAKSPKGLKSGLNSIFKKCPYFWQDTLDRVKANLALMDKLGFHFGAKIVRGAYMAQERNRAADMGYDDPIHDSYEDTCNMYDQVVETVLQRVSHTPAEIMVASHNEESVQLAVQRYANILPC